MKLSLIIPAKNEHATLSTLLPQVNEVLSKHFPGQSEVILVNDHSTDRTAEIGKSHGAKVVDNPYGPGKGHALIAGFEHGSGDYLLMMDADGSHLPEFIPEFVNYLEKGFGLVIGSRY